MAFRSGVDSKHLAAEISRLVQPSDQRATAALLNEIRDLGWDVVWLRLAALHLAGGRLELLAQWIELANTDPRDLAVATMQHLDPLWDAKYQWPP